MYSGLWVLKEEDREEDREEDTRRPRTRVPSVPHELYSVYCPPVLYTYVHSLHVDHRIRDHEGERPRRHDLGHDGGGHDGGGHIEPIVVRIHPARGVRGGVRLPAFETFLFDSVCVKVSGYSVTTTCACSCLNCMSTGTIFRYSYTEM